MFERFERIAARYEEISAAIVESEVIADVALYQAYLKERAELEPQAMLWAEYCALCSHEAQAREMLDDPDLCDMAQEELSAIGPQKEELEQQLRILLLPRDPNDDRSVILEIRAGAGGEESALFAADMMRLYTRCAERHGYRMSLMDLSETELGGVKEAILSITGTGVYSLLKYESGVHRVQRIPVTDANGKRQSSTITVAVLPEAEDVDVAIDPKDLRIDTYRSTGKGGQHINTTDSAVRITHVPTGTVVTCQGERSQIQNRARAMMLLRSRLLDRAREDSAAAYAENRRIQVGTGDRSERIRTYNFHEGRVSDHRIGLTVYGSIAAIMDGDLDEIITALKTAETAEKLRQLSNRH